MGIEPTSSAWEAEVMAIIRRPQNAQFYRVWVGMASVGFWLLASKLAWLDAGAVASHPEREFATLQGIGPNDAAVGVDFS